MARVIKTSVLTEKQKMALKYLKEHGEATPIVFAKFIKDDVPYARNLLNQLVLKGYAEKYHAKQQFNGSSPFLPSHKQKRVFFIPTEKEEQFAD